MDDVMTAAVAEDVRHRTTASLEPPQITAAVMSIVNTSCIILQYVQNQNLQKRARRRQQRGDESDEDMDTDFSQSTGPGSLDILVAMGQAHAVDHRFRARETSTDWWDCIVLQTEEAERTVHKPLKDGAKCRREHRDRWDVKQCIPGHWDMTQNALRPPLPSHNSYQQKRKRCSVVQLHRSEYCRKCEHAIAQAADSVPTQQQFPFSALCNCQRCNWASIDIHTLHPKLWSWLVLII
ncbi:hypothetical protein UY3_16938 [Chelonia mydas]|uniref:Uncharacterized protein n=1 Tax=Chelonia mydas TaxID=8469 RepID=M7AL91_CHEMY|nr:hypothetical protein UY3_16938 [Chelonia mydas]